MLWRTPKNLDKFRNSPLYARFLHCFRLEDAPESALAAATADEHFFLDSLSSITTISFPHAATAEQRQKFDTLEGLGYRYMGPGLAMTKANVNYDLLWLSEPQLGPTGERFEQALMLHVWGDADWRRQFHEDWPDRQAVWEERLQGLGASSIHEETAFLIRIEDDLTETEKLELYGKFLDADAKASLELEVEASRIALLKWRPKLSSTEPERAPYL